MGSPGSQPPHHLMKSATVAFVTKKLLKRMKKMSPGVATCRDWAGVGATAATILKKFVITGL